MRNITVNKAELQETLKKNRETHRADFEIAWEAFRGRAIENLEAKLDALKDANRGQQINLWVNLEVPEDHTDDYDRALSMLEWEVGDEVELQEAEFRQLVQDQWGWTGKFRTDVAFYTSSESPSSNTVRT